MYENKVKNCYINLWFNSDVLGYVDFSWWSEWIFYITYEEHEVSVASIISIIRSFFLYLIFFWFVLQLISFRLNEFWT